MYEENDQNVETMHNHLTKIDETSSVSKSVPGTKVESQTNNVDHKRKKNIISSIIRHLSHSKSKGYKINKEKDAVKSEPTHAKKGESSSGLRQKSFRKRIFNKLHKKKEKTPLNSEPVSSIVGSINNGTAGSVEFTASCNDITENQVRSNLNKKIVASTECILASNEKNSRGNSVSTESEDMLDLEAKSFVNNRMKLSSSVEEESLPRDNVNVNKGDYVSPLTISTHQKIFDTQKSTYSTASCGVDTIRSTTGSSNIKLSLALYGYSNYGLCSSRRTSKSCMEFINYGLDQSLVTPKPNQSELRKTNGSASIRNTKCKSTDINQMLPPTTNIVVNANTNSDSTSNTKKKIDEAMETLAHTTEGVHMNGDKEKEVGNCKELSKDVTKPENESKVEMRNSNRPSNIKLRRSRNQTSSSGHQTRSSLIVMAVSHNSPRGKMTYYHSGAQSPGIDTAASSWSGKPSMDSALPAGANGMAFSLPTGPSQKLNFDDSIGSATEEHQPTHQNNVDDNNLNNTTVKDGNYYLNEVNSCEADIMVKIYEFQGYLDSEQLSLSNDIGDQLRCVIGKTKLLISEKFNQFKGLCEQNLNNEIADEGYRTLVSDLDGFWSMVLLQVDEIKSSIKEIECIRDNGWKKPEVLADSTAATSQNKKLRTPLKKPVKVSKSTTSTPKKSAAEIERAKAARQRLEEYKRKAFELKNKSESNSPNHTSTDFMIIQ